MRLQFIIALAICLAMVGFDHPNPIEQNSSSSPLRYVFYPSKFGAFYVYFQPVSPARTA